MRAVWMHRFGPPEVLTVEETPDPTPAPGNVAIEVEYANVTFVETQVRAGTGPFPVTPPLILGNGVGGVVAGTDQRVVSSLAGSGGYAGRAVIGTAAPIAVPDGLALDDAVALLADGRTALLLTEAAGVAAGDRVLVEAAAGGVGTLLVQLAKAAGATVVAAAGGPSKLEVAGRLGADVLADYRDEGWAEAVADEIGGVDVVFDGVGGATAAAAFELLAPAGRLVSFGRASGEWAGIDQATAAERGVTLVDTGGRTPEQLRGLAERALAAAAAGHLRPVVGQRFPLEQAAAAHTAIEARATVGKTLLEVGRP